jgi:hypothetical protein
VPEAISGHSQCEVAELLSRPPDTGSAKKVFSRGSGSIPEEPLTPTVCHSGAWPYSDESFSLSP